MLKFILNKYSILLIFTSIFAVSNLNAQVTASYVGTLPTITVCSSAQTLSLKIKNGTATNMTGITFTLHIPTGGTYVAGSVSGATESNISNLQNPVFSIANINASNSATFTYQVSFGCGVIAYQNGGGLTKELVDVSYNAGTTVTGIDPGSTYAVVGAALSIISATNNNYTGNVGDTYTQTVTMRNGGLGCISASYLKLDSAGGSVSFSNISIGTKSHDTLFFNASNMPGGDGLWCNGEDLVVTYTVKINNCTDLTRGLIAGWGCGGSNCQVSTTVNSNVVISNNLPNVSVQAYPSVNYNYCFMGELQKQTLKLVNTGTGPASNLSLLVQNYYPGNYNGQNYLDTTVAWEVRNSSGAVIGNLANFTNVSAGYGGGLPINNSSCTTPTNFINFCTGSFTSGILIPANDFIYVDVYSRANNFSCNPANCSDFYGWATLHTKISYANQCGTGSYAENLKLISSTAYTYIQGALNAPTDVIGGQVFNLNIFYSSFATYNNPNGSGSTYMVIPIAGTDFTAASNTIVFAGVTYPVITRNDSIIIGPFPQNSDLGGNNFTLPLKAICGVGGAETLNIFALDKYDSTCSPAVKVGCRTATITVHCPNPCPKGGATPMFFSLKRINFGLPDNNYDGLPDATGTIDLTKVNDHHSVNGDTLLGTWNILINPNADAADPNVGLPFTHTYVDFKLGASVGAIPSLNAINAQVTVYPLGNVAAATTCTVVPTISAGNIAHFDLSSCKAVWNAGDSLVVNAFFTVNQYNANIINGNNNSGYDIFTTQNQVYSTYTAKTDATTAPLNFDTYTCDRFNDYSEISKIWLSPYFPGGQVINGCTGTITSYMRFYTRNQEGNGIFPYEYRNFFIPDTMAVWIPPGFVYRTASAIFSGTNIPANISIADANVTQVGDTLYFAHLKNFFTPNGGTVVPGDQYASYIINFNINPTCTAVPGSYTGGTNTLGNGNGINTPSNSYFQFSSSITNFSPQIYTQAPGYIYNGPQPVLAGGGTVSSNTGTASWTVQLQNLSNSTDANNSYFYISPKGAFSNIVVMEGATIISPDANGIYQLGNLAASATRIFSITGDMGKCSLDTLKLNYGWTCDAYPTSIASITCPQSTLLIAKGYPTGLDATFFVDFTGTGNTMVLCSPFTIETVINSTLVGNLGSEIYKVVLPKNLTYIANSVQYLYPTNGTLASSSINPTLSSAVTGDTLIFNVNDFASTSTGGLTGVGDLIHKTVTLKFNVQPQCGFVSGSSIKAFYNATSICDDQLPTLFKNSTPINIFGATPSSQYAVIGLTTSPSLCNVTDTVTIINTGTSISDIKDSITIQIPVGTTLGSITNVHNGPINPPNITNGINYSWQISPSLAVGDSMKFYFTVNTSNVSCSNSDLLATVTQSVSLTCGASICNTPVIIGQNTSYLNLGKPKLQIVSIIPQGLYNLWPIGATATLSVTLQNIGTADMPPNTYSVEYFCDNSTIPFAAAMFPLAVPAGTTVSANMIAMSNNSCTSSQIVTAKVRPNSTLGSVCLCDSAELLLGKILINAVTVSGNVFNDPNAGNVNNSTGTTNAVPTGMYANLISADGKIVQSVPVNADGTYSFGTVLSGTYTVILDTTLGVKGAVAPSPAVPTGWVNTGEYNGNPNSGTDGTINGTTSTFTVSTSDVTNINLAIEQPPLADTVTKASSVNPGGTTTTDITSSFGGKDSSGGVIDSLKITSFPSNATSITINGVTYTSATFPAGGVVVPTSASGVPTTPILIDPIDGNVTVNVPYVTYDNAGVASPIPGYVKVPFIKPVPLSLNLISFNVNIEQNCGLNIVWQTANEKDVHSISILKSNDGTNFKEIGEIIAKGGNNNKYTFNTNSEEQTSSYFKLKINNINGNPDYSNTLFVPKCKLQKGIEIYPNPVNDILKIILEKEVNGYSFLIYNQLGEIVKEENSGNITSNILINTSILPKGIYYIKFKSDDYNSTSIFTKK